MKSKIYLDVLRVQLSKSLELLSEQFEVKFWAEEKDDVIVDGKKVFALQLFQQTEREDRRLWLRHYPDNSNDTKANAYSELFDIIIGTFLINASRTDDKTLQELSTKKN